jgi:hypothetical protein
LSLGITELIELYELLAAVALFDLVFGYYFAILEKFGCHGLRIKNLHVIAHL